MRWLKRIVLGVLVLALIGAALGTYLTRRAFPTIDGTVTLSMLDDRAPRRC